MDTCCTGRTDSTELTRFSTASQRFPVQQYIFFLCYLCADLLQVVALAVKLRKLQADTVVHSRKSMNRNSTLCGPYARDGWLLLALPVAAAMAITQVYDSLNLYVADT